MAVEDADVIVPLAERVADGGEDPYANALSGAVIRVRRYLEALGLCHCVRKILMIKAFVLAMFGANINYFN